MQAVEKDTHRGADQLLVIKDVCKNLLLDLLFFTAASVIHQKRFTVDSSYDVWGGKVGKGYRIGK